MKLSQLREAIEKQETEKANDLFVDLVQLVGPWALARQLANFCSFMGRSLREQDDPVGADHLQKMSQSLTNVADDKSYEAKFYKEHVQ